MYKFIENAITIWNPNMNLFLIYAQIHEQLVTITSKDVVLCKREHDATDEFKICMKISF